MSADTRCYRVSQGDRAKLGNHESDIFRKGNNAT